VVTPAYTHLLQTFGEWLGCYVAIVGFFAALLTWLFVDPEIVQLVFGSYGVAVFGTGVISVLIPPIYGFLILVSFRFAAEVAKALVSIANNTKKS
jgi:hypothetical protein